MEKLLHPAKIVQLTQMHKDVGRNTMNGLNKRNDERKRERAKAFI